jgi:predicted small metal-binding protein
MTKEINCKAAGYDNCDFLIRDEDELVELVQHHAENTHDMSIPREDIEGLMHTV